MRRGWLAGLAGAGAVLCSPVGQATEPSDKGVLFILGDLRGHLAPCGCSERMRGGIARAAQVVFVARREGLPVGVLDAGDTLFDHGVLDPAEQPEAERRAEALASALTHMGLNLRAVGPRDEVAGTKLLAKLGLPTVPPGGARTFTLGGHRVAVVAGRTVSELLQASRLARQDRAELYVGLFAAPLQTLQHEAASLVGQLDLVVAAHDEGQLSGEENLLVRVPVPLVQLESQGRSLLRLDVRFGPPGTRLSLQKSAEDQEREATGLSARLALLAKEIDAPGILPERKMLLSQKMDELVTRRQRLLSAPLPPDAAGFSARFVPIESSLPVEPNVQREVERYDHDVGRLNLAWARAHRKNCPPPAPGEASFVGTAACASCHPAAAAVWRATKHAHAYATLENVGKQFHTACIGCHVTGYARSGGVCQIDRVEGRKDVGCEACHGPGSEHVQNPSKENLVAQPAEARCVTCHTSENSPHFDFTLYLPKVLGSGHGQR